MNWHFVSEKTKPHDLQDCFAIESRERQIVPCFWVEKENLFRSYDFKDSVFYLGQFEDYDNYVLAWIPAEEIINDYFNEKKKKSDLERDDMKKQKSTVKGYDENIIVKPCGASGESKFVSVQHEPIQLLDSGQFISEYRKTVQIYFPLLRSIMSELYEKLLILDQNTYSERSSVVEEKKGKKIVKILHIEPLTKQQQKNYIKTTHLFSSLQLASSLLNTLSLNAWNKNQIVNFVKKEKPELQRFWHLEEIIRCDSENEEEYRFKCSSCAIALSCCLKMMAGDKLMEEVNSIFAYVAKQTEICLQFIL